MSSLLVSAPTYKELGSCHSQTYNLKKLKKLKVNSSDIHQRIEVIGQTDALKTGESQITENLSALGVESTGVSTS